MGDFFSGWRRKVGSLTLLMALAAISGWIRGLSVEDRFRFAAGGDQFFHLLTTSVKGIQWERVSSNRVFRRAIAWDCIELSGTDDLAGPQGDFDPQEFDWRYQFLGFDVGESHDKIYTWDRAAWWLIPYWSLTLSLTAISAYLLLKKPKTSTQIYTQIRKLIFNLAVFRMVQTLRRERRAGG